MRPSATRPISGPNSGPPCLNTSRGSWSHTEDDISIAARGEGTVRRRDTIAPASDPSHLSTSYVRAIPHLSPVMAIDISQPVALGVRTMIGYLKRVGLSTYSRSNLWRWGSMQVTIDWLEQLMDFPPSRLNLRLSLDMC